ncbi:MAG TPA: class I SAM-dependent methyltransferase [Burkholderiales bacterium]|nr:class I SAM-dependent methyltransferase [Burkholderiales bacterium]
MYTRPGKCRICGNLQLVTVLDLGVQALTGTFPRERDAPITRGPLRLVKCTGGEDVCGLLQLEHSYELREMYGENYGYRSALNISMVKHLRGKVRKILRSVVLNDDDLIVDIGSNDSTTLQAYPYRGATLVGIDPTGVKFAQHYPPHIHLIPDFFSARVLQERFPGRKAKVVTSFSMFYDLEDPVAFMREVHQVLAEDGVWVFEQSYMPTMLDTNSYDTVCHEHLEYYGLRQIKWMTDRVGFTIVDVELNDINGGSFSVMVQKSDRAVPPTDAVERLLDDEKRRRLDTLDPYAEFAKRAATSRMELLDFLRGARKQGKTVAALGASTKGNVILQYCGLTDGDIVAIGEVNSDKYGSYTPGSRIPIVPEDELLGRKPDYLLVLPWHFRRFFEESSKFSAARLFVPLPRLEFI